MNTGIGEGKRPAFRKIDLHTHTTFCDGKNTPEEMVEEAVRRGMETIGLCVHTHTPFDERYCASPEGIREFLAETGRLKDEYKGQIRVLAGAEQDLYSDTDVSGFDYVIASVHYIRLGREYYAVDESEEILKELAAKLDHDLIRLSELYFEAVDESVRTIRPNIIGHLDLLMKYNDKEKWIRFDDPEYLEIARACIDAIGDRKIYEVNPGAMARGYRTMPYPHRTLLAYMKEKNLRLMLNSDCHDKTKLTCGYELSLRLLKEAGFTELWILKNGRFQPADINLFH